MTDSDHRPPEELYRRVRGLRLNVLRRVRTGFAGSYASAFRGPGIEFEEFTPYQPGDDVRHIDWHVTARRRRPHVKRYREERELRVLIVMDLSASMAAEPAGPSARQRALQAAAALALSAAYNGDRVGGMLFADRMLATIRPRRGEKHALNLLRRALDDPAAGLTTDLRPALRHIRNLRAHSIVVLLTDFFCRPDPWDPAVRRLLAACADKHEMIALRFLGCAPAEVPTGTILRAEEPESGRRLRLETSATDQGDWAAELARHRRMTLGALAGSGVRVLELAPGDDQISRLRRFLNQTHPRRVR